MRLAKPSQLSQQLPVPVTVSHFSVRLWQPFCLDTLPGISLTSCLSLWRATCFALLLTAFYPRLRHLPQHQESNPLARFSPWEVGSASGSEPEGGEGSLATREKSGCGGGSKLQLGILSGNSMLESFGGMPHGLGLGIRLVMIVMVDVKMFDGGCGRGQERDEKLRRD